MQLGRGGARPERGGLPMCKLRRIRKATQNPTITVPKNKNPTATPNTRTSWKDDEGLGGFDEMQMVPEQVAGLEVGNGLAQDALSKERL